MADIEIQWEEPPAAALIRGSGSSGPYLEFALALRENPGRWARVPRTYTTISSASAAAQNMRAGKVKGFTKGDFEVVRDELVLWARCLERKAVDPEATDDADDAGEGQKPAAEEPTATKASTPKAATPVGSADDEDDDDDSEPIEPRTQSQYSRRVREWARDNGYQVGLKGRLPRDIFEAYHRTTEEPWPQAPLRSVR